LPPPARGGPARPTEYGARAAHSRTVAPIQSAFRGRHTRSRFIGATSHPSRRPVSIACRRGRATHALSRSLLLRLRDEHPLAILGERARRVQQHARHGAALRVGEDGDAALGPDELGCARRLDRLRPRTARKRSPRPASPARRLRRTDFPRTARAPGRVEHPRRTALPEGGDSCRRGPQSEPARARVCRVSCSPTQSPSWPPALEHPPSRAPGHIRAFLCKSVVQLRSKWPFGMAFITRARRGVPGRPCRTARRYAGRVWVSHSEPTALPCASMSTPRVDPRRSRRKARAAKCLALAVRGRTAPAVEPTASAERSEARVRTALRRLRASRPCRAKDARVSEYRRDRAGAARAIWRARAGLRLLAPALLPRER